MVRIQVKTRPQKLNCKLPALLSLLIVINLFSTACTSSEPAKKSGQRVAEAAPVSSPSAAPTAEPTLEEPVNLPPPKTEEAREAIARVYKDVVTIDARHQPAYIVGDFNNDGSQDIAVVVRPAKDKLEEINDEFANWIVEDPRLIKLPDPHKSVQPLPPNTRPVIRTDDLLLTIIHGYKREGWRNKEAQQTYLLDNAVGSAMTTAPLKDVESTMGKQDVSGDVIKETLSGERGFLYWTGAKYAWKKQ